MMSKQTFGQNCSGVAPYTVTPAQIWTTDLGDAWRQGGGVTQQVGARLRKSTWDRPGRTSLKA